VKAYVSGPLTGVEPDPRPIYEHAAEVLKRRGLEAYVPHKATDPKLHPHVTAAEVYARDRFHVLSADLVIAFLAPPSLGVGIELELAAAALLPVIALQPTGSVVSRMARGVPTRIFGPHEYETRGNVTRIIEDGLSFFANTRPAPDFPAIGERMRWLRQGVGMSRAQLAELVGTTTERVQELEEAAPRISNPSLAMLAAVAGALGQEPSALLAVNADQRWGLDEVLARAPAASEHQLTLPFAGLASDREVAEVEG